MKRLITRFLLAADTRTMTAPFHNRIRKVCPLMAATLILPALTISFAVPTFAQEKETVLTAAGASWATILVTVDPQLIEQLNAQIGKKYDEAFNNNDAAAVAALYTEDAIFLTDRGSVNGRQGIEKWYADVFKAVHPKNYIAKTDPNSFRIIGTADSIECNGEWSDTFQGQNGEAIQAKGYWYNNFVREGDDWKIRKFILLDVLPMARNGQRVREPWALVGSPPAISGSNARFK
jgi:uncharacterized protein (TIGR02246 family)